MAGGDVTGVTNIGEAEPLIAAEVSEGEYFRYGTQKTSVPGTPGKDGESLLNNLKQLQVRVNATAIGTRWCLEKDKRVSHFQLGVVDSGCL